jgi:hypothetical protein
MNGVVELAFRGVNRGKPTIECEKRAQGGGLPIVELIDLTLNRTSQAHKTCDFSDLVPDNTVLYPVIFGIFVFCHR